MTRRLGIAILLGSAAFAVAPGYAQTLHEDASDVIVVTGQHPRDQASSGTKTDTPLAETPQSITVITADDIAGLGLQNLNQALRFVAGVTPEQRGSSGEVYDQFKLRGFDAPGLSRWPEAVRQPVRLCRPAGRRLAARPDRGRQGPGIGTVRPVEPRRPGRAVEQAAARPGALRRDQRHLRHLRSLPRRCRHRWPSRRRRAVADQRQRQRCRHAAELRQARTPDDLGRGDASARAARPASRCSAPIRTIPTTATTACSRPSARYSPTPTASCRPASMAARPATASAASRRRSPISSVTISAAAGHSARRAAISM